MEDITSIRLCQTTKKRLDALGKKGDTHDAIVSKLLDQMDPKTIEDALSGFTAFFERLRLLRNEANQRIIADQLSEVDPLSLGLRKVDSFIVAFREKLERWAW